MNRSLLAYFWGESWHEIQMGLKSLVVPVVFVGLSIYMVLIFLNADYMRSMGAVDIYRNSAHLTYLMASGQSLWLYFGWAWVFAQVVVRDQNAQLQEVVLAAPVPLHLTLMARFCGALVIALIMGTSIFFGFLMAPLLVSLGALPAEAVGPAPWEAFGWAIMVFTLPNALGVGAIFLCAAIWTRSTAGPFGAAAAIALVWMVAMIVLRSGEVDVSAASVLDPSGYSEAERQSVLWTPAEKKTAIIELTDLLIYNRLVWVLLPLGLLGFVLSRLNREQLAIASKAGVDEADSQTARVPGKQATLPAISGPNWIQALVSEGLWQFKLITSGFAVRLALFMLLLTGAIGSWVNFVGHVDGPLIPTPQGLLPYMGELFYVIVVFMVVGFVGVLMRRDDLLGYEEWVDTSYAPMWVGLVARSIAALALIALLCLVPALSAVLVTAIGAPEALDLAFPFVFMFLTMFPALAEVGAMAIIAHALFRYAGTAYVVSILIAFIAIINHEVSVVEYPPAQIAMPTHAHPSELAGWSPWLPMVFSMAGLKMALVLACIGFSWLMWRRGTALTVRDRFEAARKRLFGVPGLVTLSGILAVAFMANLLNVYLIQDGEFESKSDEISGDLAWESKWWERADPFSVRGGSIDIKLDPLAQTGEVSWALEGLVSERLHGTLPHGVTLGKVTVDGVAQSYVIDGDHFAIKLSDCNTPCTLAMQLQIDHQGWPLETAPWLHASGIWLRAENVLPALGHDPRNLVRSIGDRKEAGFSETLPSMPSRSTLATISGVAPAGEWRWTINTPGGHAIHAQGSTAGMLDFAYVWLPNEMVASQFEDLQFITSPTRQAQAKGFAADLAELQRCIASEIGQSPEFTTVVQSPRDLGDIGIHGDIFWAPEDVAWDSNGTGLGGWQRQFNLSQALGRKALLGTRDLRAEAAAHWLVEGVSGWAALRCVEHYSGTEAGIALRKLHANSLNETFAELDEPVTTTAVAYGDWMAQYATLALDNWGSATPERTPKTLAQLMALTPNGPLMTATQQHLGLSQSESLLGPPKAADVVITKSDLDISINASRWSWSGGGWKAEDAPSQLMIRNNSTKTEGWVDLASPELPDDGLVMDASARFERTLDDNKL
ncbi:MAG: hypothetical protein AAF541_17240 [Pseudomonadota bacterium]